MAKIKPAGKAIIAIVLGVSAFFAYTKFKDVIIPQGDQVEDVSGMMAEGKSSSEKGNKCLEVGVVTWGGYAGGQYYNGGFKDSDKSRFRKDGLCVNFSVMDDFKASRDAFRSGDMDLMWVTMDAFPTESGSYGEPVKFLFQSDWSRGGDAIVTNGGITSVAGLMGKKVAVAPATPSHTFLLWMLDMGGLSVQDLEIIEVPSAIDAAQAFKAKKVDAAVVWSPDDEGCIKAVSGAKVLISSKQATHIISDGFMVKESVFKKRRIELTKLAEGWLTGAQEINESESAKNQAASILASGLSISNGEALNAINNVRLTTYGDNLDFFSLNPDYDNTTGKNLYQKMSKVYKSLRLAENPLPYEQVIDTDFIKGLNVKGDTTKSEEKKVFQKSTEVEKQAVAIASKPVRISFPTAGFSLEENAKMIIDLKFVDDAKAFQSSRIRIEGNTDNTGSKSNNIVLSQKRAQAVVDYLVNEKGMDVNRFIVVGNGPDKPVCQEDTESCRAQNRRTDFQILQ
jgi:NitT/TauT family transport system substrate-binding protein